MFLRGQLYAGRAWKRRNDMEWQFWSTLGRNNRWMRKTMEKFGVRILPILWMRLLSFCTAIERGIGILKICVYRSSSNNSSIDAIFLLKAWQKWNQHPKILIPVCNWWNACRSAFSKSMIMPDPFISISSSWTYFRRLSTLPSFYGTLEHTRLDIISFLHRHDWTENLLFDVLNAQNIQTLRAFEILFGFLRNSRGLPKLQTAAVLECSFKFVVCFREATIT